MRAVLVDLSFWFRVDFGGVGGLGCCVAGGGGREPVEEVSEDLDEDCDAGGGKGGRRDRMSGTAAGSRPFMVAPIFTVGHDVAAVSALNGLRGCMICFFSVRK